MSQTTHVRVGDPDPNPAERAAAGTEDSCAAEGDWWQCTRPPGHAGDHVAGTGDEVGHVWPPAR